MGTSRLSKLAYVLMFWNLLDFFALCRVGGSGGQVLSISERSQIRFESLYCPVEPACHVRARSPSEMLLFDLTGTGLPTESRDYTVSVEHKQTVG